MRTKELASEFLAVPQIAKLEETRVSLGSRMHVLAPAGLEERILDRLRARGISVAAAAGDADATLEVEIAPRTPWRNNAGDESYRLEIRRTADGRALLRLAGGSARAVLYGMQTIESIVTRESFQTGVIEDWPSFPMRGIVEGFYGRPWSNAERLELIDFLAEHRFNHYIYAPKSDAYHRQKWREPYPDDAMAALAEQIDRCERHQITWVFAVSPGLSLEYSSASDLSKLIEKFRSVYELGCRNFGLFFDDVPLHLDKDADIARFESLADAQATLIGDLYRHFQMLDDQVHFFLCPTIYSGIGDSDYLRHLGAHLPAGVDVFWTGPAICPEKVTTDMAVAVAEVLGRPPILWDNYPVNDGLMASELHLAPYSGRDGDLHRSARGVFANPMTLARASEVPLACVGAYVWNPRRYRANAVWKSVIEETVGDLSGAFEQFAACNPMSCLYEQPQLLIAAVDAFKSEFWSGDFHGAIERLSEFFVTMEANVEKLLGELEPRLLDEVLPWLEDALFWSRVGQHAAMCYRTAVEILTAEGQHPAAELVVRHHQAPHADVEATPTGAEALNARTTSTALSRDVDGMNAREAYRTLRTELRDSVDLRTKACGYVIKDFAQDAIHALVAVSRELRDDEGPTLRAT